MTLRRTYYLILFFSFTGFMYACSYIERPEPFSSPDTFRTEYAALEGRATAEKSSFLLTTTALTHMLTVFAPPTSTPIPKSTSQPTQSQTPPTINLEISQESFIVDYERILVVALVANHSTDAVIMSQYQISLFDSNEKLIQASTGLLDYIPAGETIALTGMLLTPRKTQYSPEYHKIAKIQIQISGGQLSALEINSEKSIGSLSTQEATYFNSDYFPKVSGVISSDSDFDLVDIPVAAILYDEKNIIIGGGFSYIPFIIAHGEAPVEIGVVISGKPDRVELLPRFSISSFD